MAKDYNPFRPFKDTDVLLKGHSSGSHAEDFPETQLTGQKEYVSYYQWIPIIISVQAFLFYAPHLVWLALASNSGKMFRILAIHIFCSVGSFVRLSVTTV